MDAAFDPQDRSGTVLADKYQLEVLLGEGGMASVYRATHRNGSRVAIKILHRILSVDKDIRERFLREGYAANSVGHKGAVHVIDDAVAEDGSVFLVMEYLDGVCVNDVWERRRLQLSPQTSLSIVHGLLDILVSAHENRVIHRDIKPENIFITREGDIKLLDFGIARLPQSMRSSTPTETGARLGTPAFMPPEQAKGNVRDIDARSDLYGVGAVLFTLMTGHYVYDCSNPSEYLIKAATEPARPLASVLPEIPASVAHVVDKALAFDKQTRWASAEAMLQAVRAACVEHYESLLTREQLGALSEPRKSEVLEPADSHAGPFAGASSSPPRSESGYASHRAASGDAPTLAESGALSSTSDSDVASVRTASFSTRPEPGRHLWLLGLAGIVVLAFSGAIFFGARSATETPPSSASATAVSAEPVEPATAPPATVAPPEPSPSVVPPATSSLSPLPPSSASPAPPRATKTTTPSAPVEPATPRPVPSAGPSGTQNFNPYLYQ